jgi:NADPH:quinone reductase-like Zn-dependent oxidoreductase
MTDVLEAIFAIASGVGAVYMVNNIAHPFQAVHRHFVQEPLDLQERYGDGSWVVVTGGTSGIGSAFALAFASRGFNIVIIARNNDKIVKITEEINKSFSV